METKRRPQAPRKRSASVRIPAGFHAVTPQLTVDGGAAALEFYQKAFGARVLMRRLTPDGKLLHARLRFGDSIVMVSDTFPGSLMRSPTSLGGSGVTIHLYSSDVDRLWSRAVQAGAKVTRPLQNQFWGERYGQVMDPFGHHWSMAQPIRMSRAERKILEEQAMAMFARSLPVQGGAAEPA